MSIQRDMNDNQLRLGSKEPDLYALKLLKNILRDTGILNIEEEELPRYRKTGCSMMEQSNVLLDKRDAELLRRLEDRTIVLATAWGCDVLRPRS